MNIALQFYYTQHLLTNAHISRLRFQVFGSNKRNRFSCTNLLLCSKPIDRHRISFGIRRADQQK